MEGMSRPEHDAAALRRLARGLVLEGPADAVQDAWLAALRRGPERTPDEGWFAGAVRRIALGRRREEARRRAREATAARSERDRAAEDVPERLEVLRALLAAVERLDEPYRAAVVMRYLDDLPPREIAQRIGVPVDTARTRVRRGLERLRADLDGPRGPGREALLGALVPLVGPLPFAPSPFPAPAATWSTPLAGALAVKKTAVTVAALLAVSAVAWIGLREPVGPSAAPVENGAALAAAPDAAEPSAPARPEAVAADEVAREAVVAEAVPTWRLRGRLTVGDHEPLPGGALLARVHRGAGTDGEVLREQRLAADGAGLFTWEIEEPTELVTVAFRSALADAVHITSWFTYAPGDPHEQPFLVWVYPLDVELRGRVLGPDGAPVRGARVSRTYMEAGGVTESDADGRYVLSTSSAWSETRLTIVAEGLRPAQLPFGARPGASVMELPDVQLEPDHVVAGRVVDESGAGLAGVQIALGSSFRDVVESTEDGAFEIGGIDPERADFMLFARLEGRVVTMTKVFADSAPVELVLPRGLTVTGRVVDEAGSPLPYAQVRVECLFQPMPPGLDVRGGEDGRFSISHVPSGAQKLWIDVWGRGSRRLEVALPSDAGAFDVGDVAVAAGRSLSGRLVDENDAPVAWGLVWVETELAYSGSRTLSSRFAWCDEAGRFSFAGLHEGPLVVTAEADGYARFERRERSFPEGELLLRMERGAGLAGRVLDAETGAPVQRFRVSVQADWNAPEAHRLRFGPAHGTGTWMEDPEGEWRIEDDLPADRWVIVEVGAEGFATARLERAVTAVDPDPAACEVALVRETLVRGQVVDPQGIGVAGAQVSDAGQRDGASVTTDAYGRFELRGLSTGERTLAVAAEGFASHRDGPFELASASVTRRIELRSGGRIAGRVVGEDGAGLAGMRIDLQAYDGNDRSRSRRVETDADGRYAFEHLAAGHLEIQVQDTSTDPPTTVETRLVDLQPEQDRTVDLGACGSATLRGTVRCAVPLPEGVRVRLSLIAMSEPGSVFRVGRNGIASATRNVLVDEGEFVLRGVEPGRWILMGTAQPDEATFLSGVIQSLELAEGQALDVELTLNRP